MTSQTLTVDFTIGEDAEIDSFALGGTIKPGFASDIISAWLKSQMKNGPDGSDMNRDKTYHIKIIQHSDNSFTSFTDCGNRALRDGILMHVLNVMSPDE